MLRRFTRKEMRKVRRRGDTQKWLHWSSGKSTTSSNLAGEHFSNQTYTENMWFTGSTVTERAMAEMAWLFDSSREFNRKSISSFGTDHIFGAFHIAAVGRCWILINWLLCNANEFREKVDGLNLLIENKTTGWVDTNSIRTLTMKPNTIYSANRTLRRFCLCVTRRS